MPIIVSTNLKKLNQKQFMTYTRDTKNFDAESFQKDLLDNRSIIGNSCNEDGNSLMRSFINIFNDTLNNDAPLRKQTRKERKLESKPWLTKEILISIKHKNKLFVECLKNQNLEKWQDYKKYRNCLTHTKKLAKKVILPKQNS